MGITLLNPLNQPDQLLDSVFQGEWHKPYSVPARSAFGAGCANRPSWRTAPCVQYPAWHGGEKKMAVRGTW